MHRSYAYLRSAALVAFMFALGGCEPFPPEPPPGPGGGDNANVNGSIEKNPPPPAEDEPANVLRTSAGDFTVDHYLDAKSGRQAHVTNTLTGDTMTFIGPEAGTPTDIVIESGGAQMHLVLKNGVCIGGRVGEQLFLLQTHDELATVHVQDADGAWQTLDASADQIGLALLANASGSSTTRGSRSKLLTAREIDPRCDAIDPMSLSLPTPFSLANGVGRTVGEEFVKGIVTGAAQTGIPTVCDVVGVTAGVLAAVITASSGFGAWAAGLVGAGVDMYAAGICSAIVEMRAAPKDYNCQPEKRSDDELTDERLRDADARQRTELIARDAKKAIDDGSDPIAVALGAMILDSAYDENLTCTPGFQYNVDTSDCRNSVGCPESQPHLRSDGLCWSEPEPTCPPGFTYSANAGDCRNASGCPESHPYLHNDGQCWNVSESCPSGFTFNPSSGDCRNASGCPDGFPYLHSDGQCHTMPEPPPDGCSPGYSPARNAPNSGMCCPDSHPYIWGDGKCHTQSPLDDANQNGCPRPGLVPCSCPDKHYCIIVVCGGVSYHEDGYYCGDFDCDGG